MVLPVLCLLSSSCLRVCLSLGVLHAGVPGAEPTLQASHSQTQIPHGGAGESILCKLAVGILKLD